MELLNFLIYWSHRVREWFGSLYERGRDVTLNALNWVLYYVGQALTTAYRVANDLTSAALSTAWNWIQERYYSAISYADNVRNWLLTQLNNAISWLNSQRQALADWAAGIVVNVQNLAARWVSDLQSLLAGWIQQTRDYAAAIVKAVQDFAASQINNVLSDLANVRSLVFGQNSAGTPVLGAFLSNPFGFVLAYVFNAFQDLLCFGIAYGLGTTKYDLPPLPDWNGGGITGGVVPPSTAPPGDHGLVPPLNSISVSGYTFGPSHTAVDLGLSSGDPVYSMHNGRVLVADFSNVGYGLNVVVSGGDWWIRYAHLESLGVSVGDNVNAGQAVGRGNSTGNSTGPHLHLEIKYKGQFIDPLTVL